jgi:hypothetical protein
MSKKKYYDPQDPISYSMGNKLYETRSLVRDGLILLALTALFLYVLWTQNTGDDTEQYKPTELQGVVVEPTTTTIAMPTTTVPSPPPTYKVAAPAQPTAERWDALAQCECGGNYGCNTGNGFGGAFQFMHQASYSSWRSYGGEEFAAHPWEASREQQIVVAERIYNSVGWSAWPACSRKLGFR